MRLIELSKRHWGHYGFLSHSHYIRRDGRCLWGFGKLHVYYMKGKFYVVDYRHSKFYRLAWR